MAQANFVQSDAGGYRMPRFQFSIGSREAVREAGIVTSDSFSDALEAIGSQIEVSDGDTLEIGVPGFPPARFDYVLTLQPGESAWRPARRLAA